MKIRKLLDTAFILLLCILFLVLARIGVMSKYLAVWLTVAQLVGLFVTIVILKDWD